MPRDTGVHDEQYDESIGLESPEPGRLFPVHQFHSTSYENPQAVSDLDEEEAFEAFEYIPRESLNPGF